MLTRSQKAILRFLRKYELSAAQLFLLWRHYPDAESCVKLPELAMLSPVVFHALPPAPGPVDVFSADELSVVLRLINLSEDATLRYKGWALVNRCAWERLFPDSFSDDSFPGRVASRLLVEANNASDLTAWVEAVFRPQCLYYDRCVELLAVDVCRAASTYQVDEVDFKEFLSSNTAKSRKLA